MPFLNLGALKDFEKPQGAESSPKKNVKVSTYENLIYWILDSWLEVLQKLNFEFHVFNEVQPSKWFYPN